MKESEINSGWGKKHVGRNLRKNNEKDFKKHIKQASQNKILIQTKIINQPSLLHLLILLVNQGQRKEFSLMCGSKMNKDLKIINC